MKLISLGLLVSSILLLPGAAFGQYGYVPECKETVANQLNLSPMDIDADLGPYTRNGHRIVNWQARRGQDRSGYCEFDTSDGELVTAQTGQYTGPVGGQRGFGRGGDRFRRRNPMPAVNVPRVKVNTGGHGSYHWPGYSINITRGWVDTTGRETMVALSGERNFKIYFYGRVIREDTGRQYVMRIERSDRGDARGTVTFQLSRNRNKVDYINMTGRVKGKDSSGNFSR